MNIKLDFVWQGEESIALVNRKDNKPSSVADICTILVVEDDPAIQRLIHHTLAPHAEVIQDLEGSHEYLERLDLDDVDALILDYKLPQKNGLSIMKHVRSAYPNLPIIFMTGFGNLDIARQAISGGANEYFPKPFDLKHLRQVLKAWVPTFDPSSVNGNGSIPILDEGSSLATNIAEQENYLTALDHEGSEFSARVIRYNTRGIVVEVGADFSLPIGVSLRDTFVTLGNRSIEIAEAEVSSITSLAERNWIEISLPGVWKINRSRSGVVPEYPDCVGLEKGASEQKLLPDSLQAAIADFETILEKVQADSIPFEKMMLEIDQIERADVEENIVNYAETRFFPLLTSAMEEFEKAAEQALCLALKEPFRDLAQKRLLPMMLCSPFIARVVTQPIGVPGDFGILGQLLGHPYKGHDLYSRLLNAWAITAAPSSAYRHRINLLEKTIHETVDANGRMEKPTRVLSVASGVGYEVQRFVANATPRNKVDFELIDFSSRTLLEAKKHFTTCQKATDPSMIDVILRQGSVVDLAKNSRYSSDEKESESYDLVYCAGLFDYLSERMASRVVSYLYRLLKPGGKLIVSNYTPKNASQHLMGVVLEWDLVHRSTLEFKELMKESPEVNDYKIIEDGTGTELYAIAEKA